MSGAADGTVPVGEDTHQEDSGERECEQRPVHSGREATGESDPALERPDHGERHGPEPRFPSFSVRPEAAQPPPSRTIARESFLGRFITDCLKWKNDVVKIDPNICKDPFPSDDEIFGNIGSHSTLLRELHECAYRYQKAVNASHPLLQRDGSLKTLNYGVQPFIVTVYGPTGSGKSQFLRNVISSKMIDPPPETVFFVTPEKGTVTNEEKLSWEAQCAEGVYNSKCVPITKTFQPAFVNLSFSEAVDEENLSIDSPNNVFVQAAKKGPICIIIDECMNQLGACRSISSFFHALPSKIFGRFPACTGYTVLVVLHNMNPRSDRGNIKDLKIQSKCHIISPQLESQQVSRFIKNFSFGFPTPLVSVIKDIVDHAKMHSKFSWLVYCSVPVRESFRWSYYSPEDQLTPLYVDLQAVMYEACHNIRRVFCKRLYSRVSYANKRKWYD
ncbi:IVa2 [Snake adenovirus 1]|uniref:Packaging protein 1 n=1 Tax=Snake adenovirus serotype 1 TaxID=189830 RepID=PKG1_ADES1|nr:IVa2 [Snake adenovirus 1]A9CB86.1 RecName: Full=Packaging protein 1; AltName: Full=Packaging protein IVa2 [Snake adenovirus 1]ABA47236.1 IVa2 [Snake adenovirus 1]